MRPSRCRPGFTIAEVTAALAILALALALVAQVSLHALRDRGQAAARQEAQELAANVLEAARVRAWDRLTPEWAAGQRLPDDPAQVGWKLQVRVETEKDRPHVKRVTAEVHWKTPWESEPVHPVRLVGLFAARADGSTGGKP